MELKDYVNILRKSWILIAASALIGIAVAAGFSIITSPKYVASTQLYVSVQATSASNTGELVQGTSFARQAVTSYVDVVTSALVLDKVVSELDLNMTAAQLAPMVSASSPPDTVLIDISVTNSDPTFVAEVANSVGQNLASTVVDTLEKPEGEAASLVRIETIQPALVPATPASPDVPLNIALGLLIGLAIGLGAAALRSVLDTRIQSLRDVQMVTDAPMLGGIAFDSATPKRPLVVHSDPRNPNAEAFRSLRTNLQFVNSTNSQHSFVVTSSVPGEGKSSTTANLAVALAETGVNVAVVDGDLRLPKLAEYFNIEGAAGLTDVLIGRAELADVMQKWGRNNLYVLPSGRVPPNPSELLGSTAMSKMLATLTDQFDIVLIDAPPVLSVTDAAVLSKHCGGVLLAVASGRTTSNELTGAVTSLERVGAKLCGVILTMLPARAADSHAYGIYAYGESDGDPTLSDSVPAGPNPRNLARRSEA